MNKPKTTEERPRRRKRYVKPHMEAVQLQADVAVLGACRNPAHQGCPPGDRAAAS